MPEALTVLLDQNVPRAIAHWLRVRRTRWTIYHTSDVALSGRPDEEIFAWAQQRHAVIITFDEDFADPHAVRLDRANADQNLTFGAGPHRCLGMELGRLTGRLAIRSILERYPGYRIRREGVVRYRSKGFVAGWSAMPAVLI